MEGSKRNLMSQAVLKLFKLSSLTDNTWKEDHSSGTIMVPCMEREHVSKHSSMVLRVIAPVNDHLMIH